MRFWLTFSGVSYGFHVGAEDEILDVIVEDRGTNADMGVYGRLEVRAASPADPAAAAVGQRLVVVHDLYAGYLGKPIGARLSFEHVRPQRRGLGGRAALGGRRPATGRGGPAALIAALRSAAAAFGGRCVGRRCVLRRCMWRRCLCRGAAVGSGGDG